MEYPSVMGGGGGRKAPRISLETYNSMNVFKAICGLPRMITAKQQQEACTQVLNLVYEPYVIEWKTSDSKKC